MNVYIEYLNTNTCTCIYNLRILDRRYESQVAAGVPLNGSILLSFKAAPRCFLPLREPSRTCHNNNNNNDNDNDNDDDDDNDNDNDHDDDDDNDNNDNNDNSDDNNNNNNNLKHKTFKITIAILDLVDLRIPSKTALFNIIKPGCHLLFHHQPAISYQLYRTCLMVVSPLTRWLTLHGQTN